MFSTKRLHTAPIEEQHFHELHAVHLSNPEYLLMAEGEETFTKEKMLQELRNAKEAGRTPLGVFLSKDNELVGFLEYWEQAETDGKPWIGLLMIHHDHQRSGYGSEIAKGFLRWAESKGWYEVRIGVLDKNKEAFLFWRSLGFEVFEVKETKMPSGIKTVFCMRHFLSSKGEI
ncbi:GNAT family N-acetyltransferase [Kroppenstedtia pulmonis]|uniref:GNAT family N-acetyltransferase n=1 Tax=Kroppenstedtia pulmonis TaxID=1380685 RepID=A0A7D4CMK2_9BACL|nr:GNAT family N-acetyltransferase [Kroppenstedtia pulmonis]QKG84418.1 GNAT family N-acetyltransferase [Kroppenstedtia pulmonis]